MHTQVILLYRTGKNDCYKPGTVTRRVVFDLLFPYNKPLSPVIRQNQINPRIEIIGQIRLTLP